MPTITKALEEARKASLPDPKLTPGVCTTDPPDIVLAAGYAVARRKLTNQMRRQALTRYGIDWKERMFYDVDHLVPVSLGGTNDLENLWPHPVRAPFNPRHKQSLEQRMRIMVKSGMLSLDEAQRQIATDWVGAYLRRFGPAYRPLLTESERR